MEPSSDPREEELLSLQCECADVLVLISLIVVLYPADSLVKCPVCGNSVEFQAINTHMDGPDCGQKLHSKGNDPSNPDATKQWTKLFGSKLEKGKAKRNR